MSHLVKNLKDPKHIEYFVKVLNSYTKTDSFSRLYAICGHDIFLIINALAGNVFKVPKTRVMNRIVTYIKLYTECEERGFSEESIKKASIKYKYQEDKVRFILNQIREQVERGCDFSSDINIEIFDDTNFLVSGKQ